MITPLFYGCGNHSHSEESSSSRKNSSSKQSSSSMMSSSSKNQNTPQPQNFPDEMQGTWYGYNNNDNSNTLTIKGNVLDQGDGNIQVAYKINDAAAKSIAKAESMVENGDTTNLNIPPKSQQNWIQFQEDNGTINIHGWYQTADDKF